MSEIKFPPTLSVEYKDVSMLLSALVRGATADASFYVLALAAFGLVYSATPTDAEYLFDILRNRILLLERHSSLVAQDAEALGFAVHALIRQGKWKDDLQKHEKDLISYYERIQEANWLRSPDVATAFLFGFASLTNFRSLSVQANQYLLRELDESTNGDLPVLLLGLSANGGSNLADNTKVRKWLERTHLPFKHVCMLAVALHNLDSPLSVEATNRVRLAFSEAYADVVDSNISLVRALLTITHIAAMGENSPQIISTFKQFPVDRDICNRIISVIQSDAHLFIEFRKELLAHPPAIDLLAFYLFATKRVGFANAYVVDEELKSSFQEFLNLWRRVGVRAIDQRVLLGLILTAFVASVTALCSTWLPLSDWLYNSIMNAVDSDLLKSYLDDVLKTAVLFPIYFILGSLMGVWLHGRVSWHDIGFEGIVDNTRQILKSIRNQR